MIVLTYWTSEKYFRHALELVESCERLGVPAISVQYEDLGSWKQNLSYKPTAILSTLRTLNTDVLFIDADAKMLRKPELAIDPGDADIIVYYPIPECPAGGTIFVRNTPAAKQLVSRWAVIMTENPNHKIKDMAWDESCLADAITEAKRKGCRIRHFPPSYCWIERGMRSAFPTAQPVIEHYVVGSPYHRKGR